MMGEYSSMYSGLSKIRCFKYKIMVAIEVHDMVGMAPLDSSFTIPH